MVTAAIKALCIEARGPHTEGPAELTFRGEHCLQQLTQEASSVIDVINAKEPDEQRANVEKDPRRGGGEDIPTWF